MRKFILSDKREAIDKRTIIQLHYTGWPDHGVPSGSSMDAFKQMLDMLTIMTLDSKENEKVIVHCSAGIGRTGTTIAISNMIISIWA